MRETSDMSSIVLSTLNARYIHAAVGLRYLFANLGELQSHAVIAEYEASQPAREVVESILEHNPIIVGFGVYIWNTARTREVISLLKLIRPDIVIVIGGPEVSFEYEGQPIVALSDYLITGEADTAFAELCRKILSGERPVERVIHASLPSLKELNLPYAYYSDKDIAHRVVYVEVSRGCPFTCEFCLSSIDIPVRNFDHTRVLAELEVLYKRGLRTFKFVDRTFNLNIRTSLEILNFFLERMEPGLFVHFEMVPDRFPQQLRDVVGRFPPGSLQLEIGVQTLNPDVGKNISRRQDVAKLKENISFLRGETSAYLHIDLIVGLPGESLESFGAGFDQIVALNPQEIQVGILKRLRGTPIIRHNEEYQMRYSEDPPYEVVSTKDVSFKELQRMGRFARYWDLVANSGNFADSRELLLGTRTSSFEAFASFSDWLYGRVGKRASINLKTLAELVFVYLSEESGLDKAEVGPVVARDYMRGGRSDLPRVLHEFAPHEVAAQGNALALKRQRRTLALPPQVVGE
jgi:radical SAM superfamily enzyme YgiQ (UPF0313 family)